MSDVPESQTPPKPVPPQRLEDWEREAAIWKIAKEAEAQLWTRVKKPFTRGVTTIGAMLAVFGISGYALIPGWIEEQAETTVSDSINKEFALTKLEAAEIRKAILRS